MSRMQQRMRNSRKICFDISSLVDFGGLEYKTKMQAK